MFNQLLLMLVRHLSFFLLCLGCSLSLWAQPQRFNGGFPICTPDDSPAEVEPELEQTLKAIYGGCQLAQDERVLKKRKDPEAYIISDYQEQMQAFVAYAQTLNDKLNGSPQKKLLDQLEKLLKKGKFEDAQLLLKKEKLPGQGQEDWQTLYFAWANYRYEAQAEAPWLDPMNRRVNRRYRAIINYVTQRFEQPFGQQAQMGGVVADAAQALSNCMAYPENLAWQGEGGFNMKKEDELRRLASNIAYLEWRTQEKINGRRAYDIDRKAIMKIKLALFDVIRSMERQKRNWYTEPQHGENLQILYSLSFKNGWRVDASNALKEEEPQNENNPILPSRIEY
ncbi:hypothetical protein [Saprospira grandis]|nr:hypothetical protein [Saprospira grandis]